MTLIGIGVFIILGGVGTASGTSVLSSAISSSDTLAAPRKVSHPLPKGLSDNSDVLVKGMEQSELSYEPSVASRLGEDMNDDDAIQVMENPKTKRYVFNYKFHGKVLPVYVIDARISGDKYNTYLIPVKDNKIYSLMTAESVADKQIHATEYYGFSYMDMVQLHVADPYDGSVHPDQRSIGNYLVSYR
ncbi:hypothetical protein IV54_GL000277 [Levilactobacillus paucivorans]|uniref:Uncharacterized protein n=1 Tax=Levilactobacillus paucivorans TaxID=616990 RepID=A0A0R2LTW0_9LACO|nr:hypothetical protein [Levilactobacillus paucivorans]KRO03371.1 hypothetical protein IV54_GL000277 [Levilactobacillus paucivorans]